MDLAVARRRVAEARVARLATVTKDGRPHVVPCCFVVDGDTVFSAVDAKPKSKLALRRLANVRANPSAALLVDHYAEDWTTLWWVRVDGRARVFGDGAERSRAVALLAAKYPQYESVAIEGEVLALEIERISGWEGGGA
jgi:PPOX class probable F420-dependent enzyme